MGTRHCRIFVWQKKKWKLSKSSYYGNLSPLAGAECGKHFRTTSINSTPVGGLKMLFFFCIVKLNLKTTALLNINHVSRVLIIWIDIINTFSGWSRDAPLVKQCLISHSDSSYGTKNRNAKYLWCHNNTHLCIQMLAWSRKWRYMAAAVAAVLCCFITTRTQQCAEINVWKFIQLFNSVEALLLMPVSFSNYSFSTLF